MKLRIRGDSIRLRLTRSEIVALAARGQVEDTLHFAAGRALTYRLIGSPQTAASRVEFDADTLTVYLPLDEVTRWVTTDQVGISAEQSIGAARTLSILVEKDFACLAPRDGEDETDMYDHPAAADGGNC